MVFNATSGTWFTSCSKQPCRRTSQARPTHLAHVSKAQASILSGAIDATADTMQVLLLAPSQTKTPIASSRPAAQPHRLREYKFKFQRASNSNRASFSHFGQNAEWMLHRSLKNTFPKRLCRLVLQNHWRVHNLQSQRTQLSSQKQYLN